MIRRLVASVVITLILCTMVQAKDYIKLGSWNIENLGARRGQNRFAMAEYLQLADLDILAVQEIHDTNGPGAPYRNDRLDQVIELLNEQDGHAWQYELFPKRDTDANERLCGLVWNSERVSKVGDAYQIPVDDRNDSLWDRHPYAMKFKAGAAQNDIVVISIHMKSNRQSSALDPVIQREFEADVLADAFDQVTSHFDDQDVIIIGDTNCLDSDEDALTTLTGLGMRDLNKEDALTYIGFGDGSPFDHILVPDDQPEFRFSQQFILAPTNRRSFDRALSDHLLIMTAIQIMTDDDENEAPTDGDLPPNAEEYYQNIDRNLAGPQLREGLHRLLRNNRQLTYRQLWDALAYTDEDETDPSKVVLFYTGWKLNENRHGGSPSQWNREHVWAKSKGNFGTRPGAGTDLHHIRPTDVTVNGARGSLSFDNGGNIYNDPDGPTRNRVDGDSWEPWDEVKGDVARMMFYMAVRYEESSLDLELVDSTPPQSSRRPRMGRVSTLRQWHQDDPVSSFEQRRNDRIHERQGNRNPFIDQPQWVNRIWP